MGATFISLKNHARCAIESNDFVGAIELLDLALSYVRDASTYRMRGRCYFKLGRFDEALRDFVKATAIDSKDSYVLKMYADRCAWIQNYQAARAFILAAIDFDPSDGDAYDFLGNLCLNQMQYKEALEAFDKADSFSGPEFFRTLEKASILGKLGQIQQQEVEYKYALGLLNSPDPDLAEVLDTIKIEKASFVDMILHMMGSD